MVDASPVQNPTTFPSPIVLFYLFFPCASRRKFFTGGRCFPFRGGGGCSAAVRLTICPFRYQMLRPDGCRLVGNIDGGVSWCGWRFLGAGVGRCCGKCSGPAGPWGLFPAVDTPPSNKKPALPKPGANRGIVFGDVGSFGARQKDGRRRDSNTPSRKPHKTDKTGFPFYFYLKGTKVMSGLFLFNIY